MLEKKTILMSFRQKQIALFLSSSTAERGTKLEVNGDSYPKELFGFPHGWLYNHSVTSKMQYWIKYYFKKGLYTLQIFGKSADQEDAKSLQEPTALILRAALARALAQASDFTRTTLDSWRKHPQNKFG